MDAHLITALGDELFNALRSRQTLAPLTRRYPQITLEQAYRISLHFLQRREALGEQVIGKKIGVTSRWVVPCFEIVDSRIDDWQIRIQDTVADNASCGVFALGSQHIDPRSLDLAAVHMQMSKNGQPAGSGLGSAVQGHPCAAVAWLANTLGELGIPFRRGEIILSGALAPLVPVVAGDHISLSMTGLGEASLRFVP